MFFFLVFPLRFHHHHHTHWNVMKEQPRQATDFYVSVSFPDWLLKHNENKNILPQSSFQVTFFFYVKEFTELWEMRLVVDGRRKRNVKKKKKKKKKDFLNEEKKKKCDAHGWAQAVDFGWWSSRLNFCFFFVSDPKRCFSSLTWTSSWDGVVYLWGKGPKKKKIKIKRG